MMKKVLLIGLLITYVNVHSQEKQEDFKRLIDSALTIKSIDTYNDFKEDLNKDNQTDNWKHHIEEYRHYIENIYLVDENHHPYLMSSSKDSGDIKFKQIDIYSKQNRKLLKEGIDVWKIVPNLENNRLKITIINFKVTYVKNKYQFSNGGGTTVIFEYSCEEKKWVLSSNKTTAP